MKDCEALEMANESKDGSGDGDDHGGGDDGGVYHGDGICGSNGGGVSSGDGNINGDTDGIFSGNGVNSGNGICQAAMRGAGRKHRNGKLGRWSPSRGLRAEGVGSNAQNTE